MLAVQGSPHYHVNHGQHYVNSPQCSPIKSCGIKRVWSAVDLIPEFTMSARPRPVTATVNPPLTSTPLHGPRTFLSSDGSTESLISVLDHDSYQSLPPSDDEQERERKKEEKRRQEKEQEKSDTQTSTAKTDGTYSRSKSTEPTESTETTTKNSGRLTPWEDWMIHKEKELRIAQEKEIARLKKIKEEKEKEAKEKAEKDKKCEKNVKEWNERKVLELKTREKMANRHSNAEKELKEAKKREIEQKAQAKFEEWQKQKKNEEKERKRQEKLKKEEEEREKKEREQKCEEKYKAWLKEAKKRPKSAPHSYGYAEGKLTGYYDRSAYPTPSFFNPIPWQPIPVPNQTTERKKQRPKKNVRKKFNPNKYL